MTESLELIPFDKVDPSDWDSFVDNNDDAWLWHRSELVQALLTWRNRYNRSFVLMARPSGKIKVLVPLYLIKSVGRFLTRCSLDCFGGMVVTHSLGEKEALTLRRKALDEITAIAKKEKASNLNISLSPMIPAIRGERCPRVNPLVKLGIQNRLTQTWVIDLREGLDACWNNMEGRSRTAIKKALKEGVSIRMAEPTEEDLNIYYALHCETYHRTGTLPHNRQYFESMWNFFLKKNLAMVLFAELNEKVIAAASFGIYKKSAIYWTGASNSIGLKLNAGSLLQWEAIKKLFELGIEWYEVGEVFFEQEWNKKNSLSQFKKSVGGVLYPYYRGKLQFKNARWKIQKLIDTVFA